VITIDGKNYNTISEASKSLKVSPKTVRDYIKKGIIPKPPKMRQGLREIDIYPDDYIREAKKILKEYSQQRKTKQTSFYRA